MNRQQNVFEECTSSRTSSRHAPSAAHTWSKGGGVGLRPQQNVLRGHALSYERPRGTCNFSKRRRGPASSRERLRRACPFSRTSSRHPPSAVRNWGASTFSRTFLGEHPPSAEHSGEENVLGGMPHHQNVLRRHAVSAERSQEACPFKRMSSGGMPVQ